MNTLRNVVIKLYEFIVRRELTYNEGEVFYFTWYKAKRILRRKWELVKEDLEERGYRCRISKRYPYGDLRDSIDVHDPIPKFSIRRLLVSFIPVKDIYLDCFHKYGKREYWVHPTRPEIISFKSCSKCGKGKSRRVHQRGEKYENI